jgi:hypothetical protein
VLTLGGDDLIQLGINNTTTTGTLSNAAGGTLNLATTASTPIFTANFSTGNVNNAGTLNKTGAGTQSFSLGNGFNTFGSFSNSGSVNVSAGTLALGGGGSDTGSYSVAAGATLELATVTSRSMAAASNPTGAGTLRITGSNNTINGSGALTTLPVAMDGGTLTVNNAGDITVPAVSWTAGTLTLSSTAGQVTLPSAMSVNSGTLSVSGASPTTLGSLVLNNGTLAGTGEVVVTGSFDAQGSGVTLSGAGTLRTQGSSTVNLATGTTLEISGNRTWINEGVLTLGGDDLIQLGINNTTTTGTLSNAAGGTLNLTTTASTPIFTANFSTGNVNNAGTLNKTGAGTQSFSLGNGFNTFGSFSNSGSVNVSAGTLALAGSFTITQSGTVDVGAGATMDFPSALTNAATGILAGSGTLRFGAGTSTLTNQGTISPAGTGAAGTLTIAGNLAQTTGTLRVELGGTGAGQSDQLVVNGNASFGGGLTAALIGGYNPANADFVPIVTITGTATGTFTTLNLPAGFTPGYNLAAGEGARLIFASAPQTKVFSNAAGDLNWATPANWGGSLPGLADTALISAGFAVSHASGNDTIASLTVSAANTLTVSGGSLAVTGLTTLGGGLTVSGTGSVGLQGSVTGGGALTVSGGTLDLSGPSSFGSLSLSGGVLSGSSSLTVTSSFARSGGSLGSGFSTIDITQTSGDLAPGALQAATIKLTTVDAAANLVIDDIVTATSAMTVNAAGALQVLGDARFARLGSSGTQNISAGSMLLRGGATGAGRGALVAAAGAQTVATTSAAGITLLAGAGNNNGAEIQANGSAGQTISMAGGTLSLQGGSGGANSWAVVSASAGAQTVNGASAITLSGGSGGTDNRAVLIGAGNQAITVGAGGITLSGGTGTNALAIIKHDGTVAGSSQTLTINGGGTVLLQGGASPATNVGISGGSYASIDTDGASQTLNFSAGGNLTLVGGTVGSGNEANIGSAGAQTISGAPAISLTGGASGGIAGEGNGANIQADGTQTIAASTLLLRGGAAGTENSAALGGDGSAPKRITTTGGLTITSGAGGTANLAVIFGMDLGVTVGGNLDITSGGSVCGVNFCGGAGISATPGASAPTTLSVAAGGNITLTGASVPNSGAMIGDGFNSTQPMAVSVSAGGDITLNPGTNAAAAGSFIGTDPTSTGVTSGSLTVSAPTGRVFLNGQIGGAPVAGALLRTPGSLSLDARTLDIGAAVQGATIAASGSNGITLRDAATLSSSAASGDALTLRTTGAFVNTVGAGVLSTAGSSRWLVYSADPAADTVGGLAAGFRQYDATFGVTAPAGSGNGLLYTLAPTITASLTGSVNRAYDGTVTANLSGVGNALAGGLAGDAVSLLGLPANGTFDDKNVGSGKLVTATGLSVSALDQGSGIPVFGYRFNGTATGTIGTITAASLVVSGLSASNKVYDAGTAAGLTGTATVTALGGDVVALSGTASGSFADKNVGNAKPVTVSGLTLSGADAGNYLLQPPAGLVADITPRGLSVSGYLAVNRAYDAGVSVAITGTPVVTPLGGDLVSVAGSAAGTVADKNVGNNKPVAVTGLALAGADAANYSLVAPAGLTVNITPAPLTVGGLTAADRVYNAGTGATLLGSATVAPLGSDVVAVAGLAVGSFADKNVGSNKPVAVTGLTLTGADAANYRLVAPAGLQASITPAPLGVSGVVAASKVYDAGTAAQVSGSLTGVLGSDAVSAGFSGQFASANVGNAITVNWLATLGGADAANYTLVGGTASASITPATLTYVAAVTQGTAGSLPLLGGSVTGFLGSDTLASATSGVLGWQTSATALSPAGSYAVQGFGLSASNYQFAQAAGNASALRLVAPGTTDPATLATANALASALLSVAVPAQASTPTAGRVLDAVPAYGGGNTFGSINLNTMTRDELQTLLAARTGVKKKVFADGLFRLEQSPELADARACRSEGEIATEVCVVTEALKREIQAARDAARQAAQAAAQAAAAGGNKRRVTQAALPAIERKLALLIGVNDYRDRRVPQLAGAVPDARAVGELLDERLGYEVQVLENPGKEQLLRALNQLALEARPGDSVIVYYAGHGVVPEGGGQGYWLPADVDAERPESWLSNADIGRLVSLIGARQMMLVSDSCFSGTLVGGGSRIQGVNGSDPAALLSRRAAVVMSSGGDEPVADEGREGHSVFAWHFMQSLKALDGWRVGSEVFERLREAVTREFPQTPQYGASRFGGHEGNTDYLYERRTVERAQPRP